MELAAGTTLLYHLSYWLSPARTRTSDPRFQITDEPSARLTLGLVCRGLHTSVKLELGHPRRPISEQIVIPGESRDPRTGPE